MTFNSLLLCRKEYLNEYRLILITGKQSGDPKSQDSNHDSDIYLTIYSKTKIVLITTNQSMSINLRKMLDIILPLFHYLFRKN